MGHFQSNLLQNLLSIQEIVIVDIIYFLFKF